MRTFSKRRRVCRSHTTLTLGSTANMIHIHSTMRSRPPTPPTRATPLPPPPQPIGVSTQVAWARRGDEAHPAHYSNETPSRHPHSPSQLWLLMLTLQNRQTGYPSIKLDSSSTKINLDVLHLGLSFLTSGRGRRPIPRIWGTIGL